MKLRDHNLWAAALALGEAVRGSSMVRDYADTLSRCRRRAESAGFQTALRDLYSGVSCFEAHPFLLGHILAHDQECRATLGASPEGTLFINTASRLTGAFLYIAEWLRAKLPGYPSLHIPELEPTGWRVADGGFPYVRIPWLMELRGSGIYHATSPPRVAEAMGLGKGTLCQYLTHLLDCMRNTEEWRRLVNAHSSLNKVERRKLRAACYKLENLLDDTLVTREMGLYLLRRSHYRQSLQAKIEGSIDGPAREYLEAFRTADLLIENSMLLFENVATGRLYYLNSFHSANWSMRNYRNVAILTDDPNGVFAQLGSVVLFSGEAGPLNDGLIVEGINSLSTGAVEFFGRPLAGSRAAIEVAFRNQPDSPWRKQISG